MNVVIPTIEIIGRSHIAEPVRNKSRTKHCAIISVARSICSISGKRPVGYKSRGRNLREESAGEPEPKNQSKDRKRKRSLFLSGARHRICMHRLTSRCRMMRGHCSTFLPVNVQSASLSHNEFLLFPNGNGIDRFSELVVDPLRRNGVPHGESGKLLTNGSNCLTHQTDDHSEKYATLSQNPILPNNQ